MHIDYHKPLTPMAVQRRENEAQERREQRTRQLRQNLMGVPQNQFNQSTAATSDVKMRDALAKVRENDDVSIPHSLARFHGTTIYNKPDKG